VCGESQIYSTEKDDGQTSYAVVTLKNILWPGAVTVASVNNRDFKIIIYRLQIMLIYTLVTDTS